jgi:hypothetical protein
MDQKIYQGQAKVGISLQGSWLKGEKFENILSKLNLLPINCFKTH